MPRLTFPTAETYSAEQERVAAIAMKSSRGRVAGPMPALLLSPSVAEHLHLAGAYLGYRSTVPRDAVELAILVTALQRGCTYAWDTHLSRAHDAGVSKKTTASLQGGTIPEFANEGQATAYEVALSLCGRTALPDELYQKAYERFGPQGLVELVALVGLYHSVSMTLNVFGTVGIPHKDV